MMDKVGQRKQKGPSLPTENATLGWNAAKARRFLSCWGVGVTQATTGQHIQVPLCDLLPPLPEEAGGRGSRLRYRFAGGDTSPAVLPPYNLYSLSRLFSVSPSMEASTST